MDPFALKESDPSCIYSSGSTNFFLVYGGNVMKALHRIFTSETLPSSPAQFLSDHLTGRSLHYSSYVRFFDVRFPCMARMPLQCVVAVCFPPPYREAGCNVWMCVSLEPIVLRPSHVYSCSPHGGSCRRFQNLILISVWKEPCS